jgi:predicted Fe-S protein YdhL (DUF1289 family)
MTMLTPCKNICRLDTSKDRCSACYRTTFEIGRWSQMEPQERLALVTQVIPMRRLEAELELLDGLGQSKDN